MRLVASTSFVTLLAAVSLAGTGCGVQQDRYDSLIQANHSLEEQNVALADERDAALSNLESVSRELAESRSKIRGLENRNQQLSGDVDNVAGEYDRLLARVSTLEMGPLPPEVESALIDLSVAYPQLITFDANRGMLRFASDFTFALGSAQLQAEAASTIESLADILNGPQASSLEVRIVGHTDNVPIGKPETRQKHPTNVHLSVHRAISVRDALQSAGIDPVRMQVAGYGEFRPIVANGPKGAAANRRVEVYLAPLSGANASTIPTDVTIADEAIDEPMK